MADTQINVGMNVDGVITGTDKAKRKIGELGGAAREAGRGTGAIGDGMAATSQKVEAATKSLVSSIQRTTALMDAGARGSAEYYKALANQRGVDTNALKPYLDQLEAVKVKQSQAAAAMVSGGKSLDNVGISAQQTAAALRGVPAQLTDIVVSLQGGQAPMTVLLQQGGQLKDMFGGIGPAARALGGYVMGMVNPFTAAAAAGATLAVAAYQGAQESKAFTDTLITTGNQAGVTAGRLMLMAQSLDSVAGTQGNAAAVLNQLAATGQVTAAGLQLAAQAAIEFERAGGQAAEKTVQGFAELGKAPLAATIKLNESMGYLTRSTYEQIKSLEEQGRTADAAALAQKAFADALLTRAPEMLANMGYLETGWVNIKDAVKEAWDGIKNIGRDAGVDGQSAAVGAAIARLEGVIRTKTQGGYNTQMFDAELAKLKERQSILQSDERLLRSAADHQAQQTREVEARVKWDKDGAQYLDKKVKMEREITQAISEGTKAKATQADIDARVAAIREKYKEKAGPKTSFVPGADNAREWETYMKAFGAAAVDAEGKVSGLTKTQGKLIEYLGSGAYLNMPEPARQTALQAAYAAIATEQQVEATKHQAQAWTEANKAALAYGKQLDDMALAGADLIAQATSYAAAIDQQVAATEFEASLIGQSNVQRGIALKQYQIELETKKEIARINATLASQADRDAAISAVKAAGDKAKASAAAEVVNQEFNRVSDKIEQDLTDALMRGFESGKGFAENLRDTVANMFKTLVLRPIISAVVNPVAGAITGSLGLAGAANAGQGGSLLGTASNLSSAYDTLSNGVSNAVSAGFEKLISNGVGEKLGIYTGSPMTYTTGSGVSGGLTSTGATLGQYAGMAGNALAGYGLQKAISGGYKTGESGLVDAITVAASAYFGPIAGVAAGAFNRAFGRKLTDQGLQGQFGGEAGFTGENYQFLKGGWFRSDKTKTSALDADMQSGLANQFKALQVQTALMATVLGDTGQSVADFTSSIKLSFNGLTEAQIGEKLAETFTGLANDLAKTVLGDSAFAKEGEAASQTLQRLSTSLATVNGTFDALGFSLEAVSLAGADAASDFIDLIGGLDAFKAATAGYYANFYTEAERQAQATEQLTAQLAGLGQSLPATRDGFRALVEAAEKAGDNALLAGLLNLQDEFAALVPAAEAAATAVAKANEQALASQSADRKAELAARRAAEAQAAEAMAETMRVYQEGAESFDTLRQSLLLAGDAAGLLAATTERAFANPNGQYTAGGQQYNTPLWTEGTTAAQFNYAYGVMSARLRKDLISDLSLNALSVQNIKEAMQSLSAGNIEAGLGQVSNASGLASIYAASAAADYVSRPSTAGRFGPVFGQDLAEYGNAITGLEDQMKAGKITTQDFDSAVNDLNQSMPYAADLIGDVSAQVARAASAADALGQAGYKSILFYFEKLSEASAALAAEAELVSAPIAQASASIGRFNSAVEVFKVSAKTALNLQYGSDFGRAAPDISKAALIAEAAAIASGLVTTADAAKVQEQTGLSRDAALLIDGVRAYDADSLEKAFIRASDALVKGIITEGEYATLFNTSLDIFQDVEAQSAELTRTFDALRDAAKSLADELLLDKNLSTLSGPQQLEEAQRQYRETLAAAFEGDAQAGQSLGGVAKTMLGIAQATAGNGTDYARIFGATVADARQLEAIQTPTLPVYQASQDETVRELRALREEVAALRADQREGLARVASGTNTTAKRLNEWTNNGLPATETA